MTAIRGDVDLRRNQVVSVSGGIQIVLSASGKPTTGLHHKGDLCIDYGNFKLYICSTGGTPGTWKSSAAFT